MSKTITLVGDAHGHIQKLFRIAESTPNECICLGDIGFGFSTVFKGHKDRKVEIDENLQFPANLSYIRGNHDFPYAACNNFAYMGEYGFIEESSLFYLSGAWSVDWACRTVGVDWWPNEELSDGQLEDAIKLYKQHEPKYVITHDCPLIAAEEMKKYSGFPQEEIQRSLTQYNNRWGRCNPTAKALQRMFEIHQPKEWVFGHWHKDVQFQIGETKFTCVAELSTYDLQVSL